MRTQSAQDRFTGPFGNQFMYGVTGEIELSSRRITKGISTGFLVLLSHAIFVFLFIQCDRYIKQADTQARYLTLFILAESRKSHPPIDIGVAAPRKEGAKPHARISPARITSLSGKARRGDPQTAQHSTNDATSPLVLTIDTDVLRDAWAGKSGQHADSGSGIRPGTLKSQLSTEDVLAAGIKKAERPDCRTQYVKAGVVVASIMLFKDTLSNTGCKW